MVELPYIPVVCKTYTNLIDFLLCYCIVLPWQLYSLLSLLVENYFKAAAAHMLNLSQRRFVFLQSDRMD